MNTRKRRAEELLGQSLHDELDPAERAELDRLLADQPSLRAEAGDLKNFVGRIAAGPVVLSGDLRPAVIARLSRRAAHRAVGVPHWALAAAAFVLVASASVYWIAAHSPAAVAPAIPVAGDPAPAQSSPALVQAEALIASRQFAQAYAALAKAIESGPRSPEAALACQKMSEIAFAELQWYPEAFAGYDRLRRDYADQFRADEINFTRLNLLDEARGQSGEFSSLRALDAARREGNFEAFEKILAKYPATYVASQTANELARVVARADGFDPNAANGVRALRLAQFRAKDPVAKQQLRLEVAHALRAAPGQSTEARRLYQEIAHGPYTALAQLAAKSLDAMDAPEAGRGPGL